MADLTALLADIVGRTHLLTGDAISEDYGHDEALTIPPQRPPTSPNLPPPTRSPRC